MKNNISIEERNTIVVKNMGLVKIILRQYYIQGELRRDVEQEGMIGLIKAVEHYDGREGVCFSSYASWWIRRYMESAIHRYGQVVSIPRHETCVWEWQTERMVDGFVEQLSDTSHPSDDEWIEERMEIVEATVKELTMREQIIVKHLNGMGVEKHGPKWLAKELGMQVYAVQKTYGRAIQKIKKTIVKKMKKNA